MRALCCVVCIHFIAFCQHCWPSEIGGETKSGNDANHASPGVMEILYSWATNGNGVPVWARVA